MLACAWLIGTGANAVQASPPTSFLSLERYDLDQGLSQLSITSMVEDEVGFLWIGTQEGLNRFDGHSFEVFRRSASAQDGLPSSSIDALAIDEDSRLWIGTNDAGLQRWDLSTGERRRSWSGLGLAHPTIQRIALDPGHGAWLVSAAGIDYVDRGLDHAQRLLDYSDIVDIHVSGEGRALALAADCQVWQLSPQGVEALAPQQGIEPGCLAVWREDEVIVLATRGGELLRLNAGGGIIERRAAGIDAAGELSAVLRLRNGHLLLGYHSGALAEWHLDQPGNADLLRLDQPISSPITDMFESRSGVIWIGTLTRGLYRARTLLPAIRRDLLPDSEQSRWPSLSVRAIWRDADDFLIGTDTGLLRRGAEGDWQSLPELAGTSVRAIRTRAEGGWWVGSHDGLWAVQRDGTAQRYPGLPHPQVTDLLQREDGLWISTRGGLAHWRDGAFRSVSVPVVLRDPFLTSLETGPDGRLWIGSNEHGLFRFEVGGALEHLVERSDDLLHNSIWSLRRLGDTVWAGSFSAGLQRFDTQGRPGQIYDQDSGLSNGVVYRIEPDRDGRLWLSTNDGLNVLNPANGSIQSLGPAEGLRNREFNSGASFAADGLLYFGGTEGLDIIDPLALDRVSPPATPVISSLRLLGRGGTQRDTRAPALPNVTYAQRIDFDYRDTVIALALVAIDFSAPSAARLRYRLHGIDTDWIHPNRPQTELLLSYLPAGTYRLEVQAAGRDGQFGPSRSLQMHFPPPPWRSTQALIAYAALLAAALLAGVMRLRQRSQAKREQIELLNRTVAERTIELREANQHLQQSNERLELATRTDPLTRVANRRDMQDWLEQECPRWRRRFEEHGAQPALMFCMIDIDDFKGINDRYGHTVGDQVLVEVAQRLQQVCRGDDRLARWGGEEFLLVFRGADPEDTALLAERVRSCIDTTPITGDGGNLRLSVSGSVGLAPWPASGQWPNVGEWQHSVDLADRALYAAKASGKNRWVALLPERRIERGLLEALLHGAHPEQLPAGSVRTLASDGSPVRFPAR